MRATRRNYDIEVQSFAAGTVRFVALSDRGREVLGKPEHMVSEADAITHAQKLINEHPDVWIRRP